MYFYLIKFKGVKGYTPDEEIHTYLLDEATYDRWCMADSGTEGYQKFETIWKGEIEQIYTEDYMSPTSLIKYKQFH